MNQDPPSSAKEPTAQQLDHLRATGKVTDEEAGALQSPDPSTREAAMRGIRGRHAAARLASAVADGAVTEEEAAELQRQVASGGHSRALRVRINSLVRRGNATSVESRSE